MCFVICYMFKYILDLFFRLEAKKKSEPKKVVLQDEKLTELERKLQERKAQRMKERESAKSVSNRHSASRTKSLINQKVCMTF